VSIFERIGTQSKPAHSQQVSGTYVIITNLNHEITIGDISELCSTIGEVKSVDMDISSSKHAKKSCKVLFARRSDAMTCVTKFNGLTLDGTKMSIQLAGDGSKSNPFNPVSVSCLPCSDMMAWSMYSCVVVHLSRKKKKPRSPPSPATSALIYSALP
jgi:RNA recognition motif-containing protein